MDYMDWTDIISILWGRISERYRYWRGVPPQDLWQTIRYRHFRFSVAEEYHRRWGVKLLELAQLFGDAHMVRHGREAFRRAAEHDLDPDKLLSFSQNAVTDCEEYRLDMSSRDRLHPALSQHTGSIDKILADYQERSGDNDRAKEFHKEIALLHRTSGYIYFCLGTDEAREKARLHYDKANLYGYCEAYPTDELFQRHRTALQPNYPRIRQLRETVRRLSILLFRVPTLTAVTLAALMASLVIALPFLFDWRLVIAPLHQMHGVSPLILMFGTFVILDTIMLAILSWKESARSAA